MSLSLLLKQCSAYLSFYYTDDLTFLANTLAEAECLPHNSEQAATGIALSINSEGVIMV